MRQKHDRFGESNVIKLTFPEKRDRHNDTRGFPGTEDLNSLPDGSRREGFADLAKSLKKMEEGLQCQQRSIHLFRQDTAKLEKEVGEIKFHLHRFRRNLGNIRTKPLLRKMERLSNIADDWVALAK